MKRSLLCLISAFMLLAACSRDGASRVEDPLADADAMSRLVMQVQKCSRMYTTEIKVHKIVTHDDVVRLKGQLFGREIDFHMPLGDRKIAIPMDITLKAYVDMGDISEEDIRHDGRHITIYLPNPQLIPTGCKIDNEGVREYVAFMRSRFTDDEMAMLEMQGREAVMASVSVSDVMEQARGNAARVLVPMLMQMGYDESDITVAFRTDFSGEDLRTIMRKRIERYHMINVE